MLDWTNELPTPPEAVAEYAPIVVGVTLVALVVMTGILIRQVIKKNSTSTLLNHAALLLATAYAAEGMWEVATDKLDLEWYVSAGVFLVFEAALTSMAVEARRVWLQRVHDGKRPSTGWYGAAVWGIALAGGMIASMAGDSLAEEALRISIPLLVALLWHMRLHGDLPRTGLNGASLRWTPRTILVRLGIMQAGDTDLSELDRARQVSRLTSLAYRTHKGLSVLKPFYRWRLNRAVQTATAQQMAEMYTKLARSYSAEANTKPETVEAAVTLHDLPVDGKAVSPESYETSTRVHSADMPWETVPGQGLTSRETGPRHSESRHDEAMKRCETARDGLASGGEFDGETLSEPKEKVSPKTGQSDQTLVAQATETSRDSARPNRVSSESHQGGEARNETVAVTARQAPPVSASRMPQLERDSLTRSQGDETVSRGRKETRQSRRGESRETVRVLPRRDSRATAEDLAVAAWQPGINVTGAWIMEVTGKSRAQAFKAVAAVKDRIAAMTSDRSTGDA